MLLKHKVEWQYYVQLIFKSRFKKVSCHCLSLYDKALYIDFIELSDVMAHSRPMVFFHPLNQGFQSLLVLMDFLMEYHIDYLPR